jgi:hypothetical protein
MSAMDGIIPCVDQARQVAKDIGWRIRSVTLVRKVWPGAKGEGRQSETSLIDILTISPAPRVRDARQVHKHYAIGMMEEGDIFVDAITATLTEAQIKGTGLAAGEELFYRVLVVADTQESSDVPEATAGLYRLTQAWRRPNPIGWQLNLRPVRHA